MQEKPEFAKFTVIDQADLRDTNETQVLITYLGEIGYLIFKNH